MRVLRSALGLCVLLGAGPPPLTPALLERAALIRDAGLADDVGYDLLRDLTTEVGARLAGSPGDARAVAWAQVRLTALGFTHVHAETVTVPHWVRGEARVETVSPWPQRLVAVALGGSVGTPSEGLMGDVVPCASLAELATLDSSRVRGRIVFFHGRMPRSRDGSGYGRTVGMRTRGAAAAARRGAIAVVIRSVGTDHDRVGHTGGMHYDSTGTRIPALALSNPDADLLMRQLERGEPVRLRLWCTARTEAPARSANVVGEMPGRDPRAGLVLLGAHLDSWDLAQGAHDDGAGVAIMTAAARLAGNAHPRRTIRVVLFANEEFGLDGANAYAAAHAAEIPAHVVAMESDLGAFAGYALESHVADDRLPAVQAMARVLEPLGVRWTANTSRGDADTGVLHGRGVPVLELLTDASAYFDLHHTANDTFENVGIEPLRQNVAAYAALAWLAAEWPGDFGRVVAPPD